MSTRFICKRHVLDGRGHQLRLAPAVIVHHRVIVVRRPSAGCVSEKMVYGNVCDVLLIRGLTVFFTEYPRRTKDFVSKAKFASLDQREDRNRGYWLGKIGNAKKCTLLGLSHVLAICHAARVIVDKAPILRNSDRHGGHAKLPLKCPRVLPGFNIPLVLGLKCRLRKYTKCGF